MDVVLRSREGDRDLRLELSNPDARVDDVLRAAGLGSSGPVSIDGRPVERSAPVAVCGLHEGAVLALGPDRPRPVPRGLTVVQVAGPGSGRSQALPVGRHGVGRDRGQTVVLEHRSVSRAHCVLDVHPDGRVLLTDLESANRTAVDGYWVPPGTAVEVTADSVVEIGPFALAVRPVTDDDRPRTGALHQLVGPDGTVTFNRPPRSAGRPAPTPLSAPTAPGTSHRPDLNLTTIIAPIVLAGVLVVATSNPQFALFALLSPILAVGMYVEGRRRAQRKDAEARDTYRDEVRRLHEEILRAAAQERRRLHERCPDIGEVRRRAAQPSTRLWERRPGGDGWLALTLGIANLDWTPPLADRGVLPDVLADRPDTTVLRAVPAAVELADGGVVGIVGPRGVTTAVARTLLCQAAVHHGPADLAIAVLVDTGRAADWDWAKWLPHTRRLDGGRDARWLAEGRGPCDAVATGLDRARDTPAVLVVVDSDTLTEGVDAPVRSLLARPVATGPGPAPVARVSGVVIASTADRLPAGVTTVVHVSDDGEATVRVPAAGTEQRHVLCTGLSGADARQCARDLARFGDPEISRPGGSLPDVVRLVPLLGLDAVDAESVRKQWRRARPDAHPVAPLGVGEQGVFTLDLVADGPHGLVGGTTGSGKSELLRTLVTSLATGSDPRHLTFVLIDYKGGAAFDQCGRLPHVVGLVTDLDDQLAERALVALNAELHHRERRLRDVGADDIGDYLRIGRGEPMPRLVVVVDEFATLAKELPDFMTSLVGIAQRGRSLGVHMILATQRPSGAVSTDIRANTAIKIALRVQDAADSTDVINVPDAAGIHRSRRGRAFARLGPQDLTAIQTALVTCVTEESTDVPVTAVPFTFGPTQQEAPTPTPADPAATTGTTDLARLVDAIAGAARAEQIPPPRRPWPEPLPKSLPLSGIDPGDRPGAVVALADDPRGQAQYPLGWDPDGGNLVLYGIPGSGTTTALRALAVRLALRYPPDELELQALDLGTGALSELEQLPHTGSVVVSGDRERQTRMIRHLVAELDRRRAAPGPHRRLVVLLDNLAALRAAFTDPDGLDLMDRLARVVADGSGVGIAFAVTVDRLSGVPHVWSAPQQWLFRLSDPNDYVTAGVPRRHVPAAVPGRAVVAGSGLHVQVGLPGDDDLRAAVAAHAGSSRVAATVVTLPSELRRADVPGAAVVDGEPWTLPFGVRETDLGAAALTLYDGEHALVAGPARSGRSTALWTVAEAVRAAGPDVHVAALGGRRSPLRDCPALDDWAGTPGEAAGLVGRLRARTDVRTLLLIDDAEGFDDTDGAIAGLLAVEGGMLHVVAAAQVDALRGLYSHWTKTVRRSRVGVLLKPNVDMDGDLLGVTLPRRAPVSLTGAGRGYLISGGEMTVVQVARP